MQKMVVFTAVMALFFGMAHVLDMTQLFVLSGVAVFIFFEVVLGWPRF